MPEDTARAGEASARAATPAAASQTTVRWDDANMKSSYANVCNVASTREEVVLLFGINQAWHGGQREVTVQLTDRIILSPFAAKRLAVLLGNLVAEHEKRFGALSLEGARPQGT
jgi:hypothetical protein